MGVVFAAHAVEGGASVALKLPHRHAVQSPELVVRFQCEARALQRIRSAHVVVATATGALPCGLPYIVMERLQGFDLAELLRRREAPWPVEEAVEYARQACRGLIDAHEVGIVHRDVKPANLFLGTAGDGSPLVKLLDFGIASGVAFAPRGDELDRSTSELGVMGSPAYMSPEQAEHFDAVDARADIWSVAAVLYRLLTGKHVHDEDSVQTMLVKTRTCPVPSPRTWRPDLPCALDDIISRCLERDPTRRIQTAAELARSLGPFAAAFRCASDRSSEQRVSKPFFTPASDVTARVVQ